MDIKMMSELLQSLIGGKYLDWKALTNYMEVYCVEPEELIDECEFMFGEDHKFQFNDLMYIVLYLGFEKMKKTILNIIEVENWKIKKDIIKWVKEAEFECYVNYLDSSIQTPIFSEYTVQDMKYVNNIASFLGDVAKHLKAQKEPNILGS